MLLVLALLVLATSSCSPFEEDIDYIENNTPEASIIFSVPGEALPAVPTGSQVQVTQPNFNTIAANFAAGKSAEITVGVSSNKYTALVVNAYRTARVNGVTVEQREAKAELTADADNQFVFTAPVSSLGFAGAAPAASTAVTLEFVASNAQGKSVVRFFTVNVVK